MEKRKSRRMAVNIKILYRKENESDKKMVEAAVNNIAEGGILIIENLEPLPIGTCLDIELVAVSHPHPIKAKARVVWAKEIEAQKAYEFGLAFSEIRAKDKEFIKEWIEIVDLDYILGTAVKNSASDVHLVVGQPPTMRVDGDLQPILPNHLGADEIESMIFGFCTPAQRQQFEKDLELDISYANDFGRFRVNVHQEKGAIAAAFRYLPVEIRGLAELRLPPVLDDLAHKPNGLILVTGPNGCGKSTTLAAIIEIINRKRKAVVMSLEEPIEYVFKSKKSIIEQREIGIDALSFQNALRYIVRQDVDVILIGELRDLNSISVAISAAETGHLVITTLHTMDAVSSINRIIDAFPVAQQQQIRMQLAETLRGVCSQVLVPRADKQGRVVATEILIATAAVANMIRKGNLTEIKGVMETGSRFGMHTFNQSLEDLYTKREITRESVFAYTANTGMFI